MRHGQGKKAPVIQRPTFAPIQPGASIPFMLNQEPSRAVIAMDEHIHVVRPVGLSAFWVFIQLQTRQPCSTAKAKKRLFSSDQSLHPFSPVQVFRSCSTRNRLGQSLPWTSTSTWCGPLGRRRFGFCEPPSRSSRGSSGSSSSTRLGVVVVGSRSRSRSSSR